MAEDEPPQPECEENKETATKQEPNGTSETLPRKSAKTWALS